MSFEFWSVAKVLKTCRSRKMLQHNKLVAKIDFDTAENGLPKDTYIIGSFTTKNKRIANLGIHEQTNPASM